MVENSKSNQNASQSLIPGYFNYEPRASGTGVAVTDKVDTSRAKLGDASAEHQEEPQ